jgi:hypothetical protein
MTPTGYLVYEDDDRFAVITLESDNRKTGPMAQMWPRDPRKNITIVVHGSRAKNFELIQIGAK